jgi:hypothetical protein
LCHDHSACLKHPSPARPGLAKNSIIVILDLVESELRLLSPWQPPCNPEALASELNREVGPHHPLFGKRARALAVARDRDDVFFEILDGQDWSYAVVHLTWAGRQEPTPTCPLTRFFGSLDEWHTWMTEDHEDFTWGDTIQL